MMYFTKEELACKCCGELELNEGFLTELNKLREICGFPFIVTSCCRCPEHNKAEGGHPKSLHMTHNPHHGCNTLAIDIKRMDGEGMATLIEHALFNNWTVGIAKTFIHLDRRCDIGLPQRVYTYG